MSEKRESILDLPEHLPERPVTVLDDVGREEFCCAVLRRLRASQVRAALKEATDDFTWGNGDELSYTLIQCYEEELEWRDGLLAGESGRLKAPLDREDTEEWKLIIKRHALYLFNSVADEEINDAHLRL